MKFGPFRADLANGFLYRGDAVLPIPPRAFGVLSVLLAHPNQVVTKQALLDEVWKDTHVTDTSLSEAVSLLRQALGDDPQRGAFIQTVPRRGYRFVARVDAPPDVMPAVQTSSDEPLWTPWLPWVLAIVGGVLLTSVAWSLRPRATAPRDTIARFRVELPAGVRLAVETQALAFAPDSSAIAFVGVEGDRPPMLYVRSLAEAASRRLAGTEGAEAPFFSPDARTVGYFAAGRLWRIDVDGSGATPIAPAPSPAGAAWTAQDEIIFAARWGEGLSRVTAAGGAVRPITRLDGTAGEMRHAWPSVNTDTGVVAFASVSSADAARLPDVRAWSPATLRVTTLVPRASFPHLLPGGYLVAWRWSQPIAMPLDIARLSLDDRAVAIPLAIKPTTDLRRLAAMSIRGALVSADSADAGITWLWPDGRRVGGPWPQQLVPLSLTEGLSLLAARVENGEADYRLVDLARGTEQRTAASPASPSTLRAQSSAGSGTGLDILVTRGPQVVARVETPSDESAAALSPDESLLAWQSNASGQWQVVVARTTDPQAEQLIAPGECPTWSRDGRTLWFLAGRTLMASEIDPAAGLGQPARAVAGGVARILGTAPDGRVLVVPSRDIASLDVVLGWSEEVRARIDQQLRLPRSFR